MKYQLSISIGKSSDKNSASTKAVKDCANLFSKLDYKDYNLFFAEEISTIRRYVLIFKELAKFYILLKKNSIVGIQYPMLNNVFKYFIKAAKVKGVRFFCIIHDIESLRLGGLDDALVSKEVENLNYYDCVIAHNHNMAKWLRDKGMTTNIQSLEVFDYLLNEVPARNINSVFSKTIVFAGNLAKSNFIYSLSQIDNWDFNVYGPNYKGDNQHKSNVVWRGEYSPDEVVYKLDGNFGLIWDGNKIEECDELLGNYLKYNNPHKFSLYLAAGLPVIAPKNSAIGKVITDYQLGILIDNLTDLHNVEITEEEYRTYKANCDKVKNKIIKGGYFLKAVEVVENLLKSK